MALTSLLGAIPTTLALTALALLMGLVLGSALCAARLSRVPVLRGGVAAAVLAVRLVPPILWLLLVHFVVGTGPGAPGTFAAATLGLGLIAAARLAEAGRRALSSVDPGQWDAAAALHLPARTVALEVIGPQLLRGAWPAVAAEALVLLRDTALASLVGVGEIAAAAQRTVEPALAAIMAAAVLYLALGVPLALLARRAGGRLRLGAAR